MNIDEYILIFQKSLIALVPIFDEAGIGWVAEEQYDSFEVISEALFSGIVIDALVEEQEVASEWQGYRYDLPPYESREGSFISVKQVDGAYIGRFVRLDTDVAPFDTVVVIKDDLSTHKWPLLDVNICIASQP